MTLGKDCTCRPDDGCPMHGLNRAINVSIANARIAGGCNFCDRPTTNVRIVRSSARSCGLEVRFCPECWKELNN